MDRLVSFAAVFLLAVHAPATAADTEVDLELVLAVDVSRSMDAGEQRLQRDGYVAAFRHPELIQAIQSGAVGRIAVTYFEWAGPDLHTLIAPWTIIANATDAEAFAAELSTETISRQPGNRFRAGSSMRSAGSTTTVSPATAGQWMCQATGPTMPAGRSM